MVAALKLIKAGCDLCLKSDGVWLEATDYMWVLHLHLCCACRKVCLPDCDCSDEFLWLAKRSVGERGYEGIDSCGSDIVKIRRT